jgi:hypothetical protein
MALSVACVDAPGATRELARVLGLQDPRPSPALGTGACRFLPGKPQQVLKVEARSDAVAVGEGDGPGSRFIAKLAARAYSSGPTTCRHDERDVGARACRDEEEFHPGCRFQRSGRDRERESPLVSRASADDGARCIGLTEHLTRPAGEPGSPGVVASRRSRRAASSLCW